MFNDVYRIYIHGKKMMSGDEWMKGIVPVCVATDNADCKIKLIISHQAVYFNSLCVVARGETVWNAHDARICFFVTQYLPFFTFLFYLS